MEVVSFLPDIRGRFRLESRAIDRICTRIVQMDPFPKSLVTLQGYLVHKKHPPPRTLKLDYLGSYGGPTGAVSCERGTPVSGWATPSASLADSPHLPTQRSTGVPQLQETPPP